MKVIILILFFISVITKPIDLLKKHAKDQIIKFLSDEKNCWLDAYSRGVGKPIYTCPPENPSKSGLLCYPECNENFNGVGPVCWEICPSKFHDDGAFCRKGDPYTRGTHTSQDSCEKAEGKSCERWGLLWYPKCDNGFHNVACCVCSPDCPNGMVDIGVSCAKQSYGRGVGVPLTCAISDDYDAGLCYEEKCKEGFNGIGPVCWGQCPVGYEKCGALCLKSGTCADKIKEYINEVTKLVKDVASENWLQVFLDVAEIANDFIYPNCSKIPSQ